MARHRQISAGIGGTLALEFANTAGWHLNPAPVEGLLGWGEMLGWATEQRLIDPGQADSLARLPVEIGPVLDLREAIFRAGLAVARGDQPEDVDLDAILLRASVGPPPAFWAEGMLSWRIQENQALSQLLGLIARDAVALFASDRVHKLRVCAGADCGWLFLDESRGKPRRWCSMGDCGNRAKARRAYSRQKG